MLNPYRFLQASCAPIAVLSLSAALVASPGCSSKSSSSAIDTASNEYCSAYQSCQPAQFASNFTDVSDCVTQFEAFIHLTLGAPGVTATDSDLAACIQAPAGASCAQVSAALDSDCTLPRGTLADGVACNSDLQCKGGSCSFPTTGSATCGTCTTITTTGAVGQPCSDTVPCASGLSCDGSTCKTILSSGQPCGGGSAVCAPLTYCDSTSMKCKPIGGVGAPCTSSEDCDLSYENVFCDTTGTHQCVAATVTVVADGASCFATSIDASFVCHRGSSCITASTGSSATCMPDSTVAGTTCGLGTPACAYPLECTKGTCQTATPTTCGG